MSAEITENPSLGVTENVEELIQALIKEYNFDPKAEVTYSAGSIGFGHVARRVVADIKDDKKTLSLFLKYIHNVIPMQFMALTNIYANEIYFYDVIYPELMKFAEERGVKDAFTNLPNCYGTSSKRVMAFSNLQKMGYINFDRKKIMNENHIIIVLKAFARYHGLCFAFKDQRKERFEELCCNSVDPFRAAPRRNDNPRQYNNPAQYALESIIDAFLGQLDPVQDKYILDKCRNLAFRLGNNMVVQSSKNENSIIIKGICSREKMMFRYEDASKDNPSDVKLVGWKVITLGSVALDLTHFFYTCACDEELNKLDFYLNIYHQELSKCMRKLGSNPLILYPYLMLEKEWKNNCLAGLTMAVMHIYAMPLVKPEEAEAETEEIVAEEEGNVMQQSVVKEYFSRLRNLTEHFIKNDFL